VLELSTEPHDAGLTHPHGSEAIDLMAFCRSMLRGELGSALTLTPDGAVDFASRPVLAHLGRDGAQVAGLNWISLWPQPERRKVQDATNTARGGKIARFQASSPTSEGAPRWWDVVIYPLSIDAGQLPEGQRMLAVFRNITALREAMRSSPSRRAWRPWASSPAAWPTTSTISSPSSWGRPKPWPPNCRRDRSTAAWPR
jgi:PAS domain-containing protein